jgi:hypothetical protein
MRRDFKYRYLININSDHLEVHDLDNEHTGLNECQINEIINAGNARYLVNDNTEEALRSWLKQNPSYDGCKYCLTQYHRK